MNPFNAIKESHSTHNDRGDAPNFGRDLLFKNDSFSSKKKEAVN